LSVLGVVQRKLGVFDEAFTHMTQAIFETMAADDATAVDEAQVDAAISRAKIVQREAAAFLGGRGLGQPPKDATACAKGVLPTMRKAAMEPAAVIDLTSDVDEAPPPPDAAGGGKRRGAGGGGSGGGSAGSSSSGNAVLGDQQAQLADQIAQVNRLRGVIGHNEVLPASAFNDDGADSNSDGCVQPSSALVPTAVCEGAGGGRLHADRGSASYLLSMPPDAQAALRGIREALKGAKRLVARALPSASSGSRPRVMRHWRAGASLEHVHVRLSVVRTGTATVRTGTSGRYLATRRAVEPPQQGVDLVGRAEELDVGLLVHVPAGAAPAKRGVVRLGAVDGRLRVDGQVAGRVERGERPQQLREDARRQRVQLRLDGRHLRWCV
jgi:hypothetical protein